MGRVFLGGGHGIKAPWRARGNGLSPVLMAPTRLELLEWKPGEQLAIDHNASHW